MYRSQPAQFAVERWTAVLGIGHKQTSGWRDEDLVRQGRPTPPVPMTNQASRGSHHTLRAEATWRPRPAGQALSAPSSSSSDDLEFAEVDGVDAFGREAHLEGRHPEGDPDPERSILRQGGDSDATGLAVAGDVA